MPTTTLDRGQTAVQCVDPRGSLIKALAGSVLTRPGTLADHVLA